MTNKSLRSPLGKVHGLGSAKLGTEHFLMQRLSAILLIPLGIWLCFSVASIPNLDYNAYTLWLGSPINASLMLLTALAGLYHANSGIQIVIEDYISDHGLRFILILCAQILSIVLGVISIVSVLKITLGAGA